jgi:hypothetical protein
MSSQGGQFSSVEISGSIGAADPIACLVSASKKLIVRVSSSFFHILMDTLSTTLYKVSRDPSLSVVFLVQDSDYGMKMANTVPVLEEFCRLLSDKYGTISSTYVIRPGEFIVVNNFEFLIDVSGSMDCISELVEFFRDSDLDTSMPAVEKVYLSRRRTISNLPIPLELSQSYDDPQVRKKYEYTTNDRIDDERRVETCFIDLGYTVVCPEDFTSFREQVNFFSRVKSIASVTSAGLANCIFMKPGGTVLELTTPLITPYAHDSELKSVHSFYQMLSIFKKHLYISIPHERVASDVVSIIESNGPLKQLLLAD